MCQKLPGEEYNMLLCERLKRVRKAYKNKHPSVLVFVVLVFCSQICVVRFENVKKYVKDILCIK